MPDSSSAPGCLLHSSAQVRTRPVVLLTNPIHPAAHAALEPHATVRVSPAPDTQTLVRCAEEADVIIVRAPLPEQALTCAPRLRGVIRHGAGLDMIPVEAATRLGIAVANVPKANALSVAEYVVGQILAMTHRLRQVDATLRSTGWVQARTLADGSLEAAKRTVGIVGFGAIGEEVARICHDGLRMKVLALRRTAAPMPAHVTSAPLEELFAASDVVVLACPLNESTRGMVGERLLGLMRPGAFLVNVARGAVVDERALIAALADGRLGGAALDVFEVQPLPRTSALLELPNVILSTHLAGITDDSMRRMGHVAVRQALQLLAGELPEHLANRTAAAAIRDRLSILARP